MPKVVQIDKSGKDDLIESLEHYLKLARMGEILGMCGVLDMRGGYSRMFIKGSLTKHMVEAIGQLENTKFWLHDLLPTKDAPKPEEEIKPVQEESKEERDGYL